MSTSKLEFKDSSYLDTAFPASERIYIQSKLHPSVRVPLREVSTKDGARLRVYDTRGPWADPTRTRIKYIRVLHTDRARSGLL